MASVDHLFEHSPHETQAEQEYASRDLKTKFSEEITLSQKIPGNAQSPPTGQRIFMRASAFLHQEYVFFSFQIKTKEKEKEKKGMPSLWGQAFPGVLSDYGQLIF